MRLKLPINGEMGECLQASSNTRSDGGQKGEGKFFKEGCPSGRYND